MAELLFSSVFTSASTYNFTLTLSITNTQGDTRTTSHFPILIASPLIRSFVPSFGPLAGGTRVTVSGVGLGLGSSRSAEIIGVTNCTIVSQPGYVDGDLECVTDSAPMQINGKLKGQFKRYVNSRNFDHF